MSVSVKAIITNTSFIGMGDLLCCTLIFLLCSRGGVIVLVTLVTLIRLLRSLGVAGLRASVKDGCHCSEHYHCLNIIGLGDLLCCTLLLLLCSRGGVILLVTLVTLIRLLRSLGVTVLRWSVKDECQCQN